MSIGIPGEPMEFGNGTWSSTDVLTLIFGEGHIQGTWQFDINRNGDTLQLTGADSEWESDTNGTEDPAKLNRRWYEFELESGQSLGAFAVTDLSAWSAWTRAGFAGPSVVQTRRRHSRN